MGTGHWSPIAAVVNGQLQAPAPVYLLLGSALALGLSFLLGRLARRPADSRRFPLGKVDIPGVAAIGHLRPSKLYAWIVPDASWNNPQKALLGRRREGPFAEWDTTVMLGLDVMTLQLIYWGGPILLAETVGASPAIGAIIGTVLWGAPTDYHRIPTRLAIGAWFAWLWITGGWWLAIGSHVGVLLGIDFYKRISEWRKRQSGRGARSQRNETSG